MGICERNGEEEEEIWILSGHCCGGGGHDHDCFCHDNPGHGTRDGDGEKVNGTGQSIFFCGVGENDISFSKEF